MNTAVAGLATGLLGGAAAELAWQDEALCAQTDPESFFPEKGASTREAKATCMRCSVRLQCLVYALFNDERFGVWGGLSERERRRLAKRMPGQAVTTAGEDDDADEDVDELGEAAA